MSWEAYNSITPFFSRTELAWITPLLLTVCACKSTWPASATILPWLSTLPAGNCTGADKLNPFGRSDSKHFLPGDQRRRAAGRCNRSLVLDLFADQKQRTSRRRFQMCRSSQSALPSAGRQSSNPRPRPMPRD